MATLLKCNAVFLHLPKTGGTYLRNIFEKLNLIQFDFARDHADMERVINISKHYPGNYMLRSLQLRKDLESHVKQCYKFTFVRNPFDWYESYWRFMQDHHWRSFTKIPSRTRFGFPQDTWHPFFSIEKYGSPDFNKFIENIIKYEPGYLTKMYASYTTPEHIDYVGKQETIEKDILHILEHLKVHHDPKSIFPKQRINESLTIKPAWDKNNKKNLYELERESFEKYGYGFEL